jgi:hypothetical protein
MAYYSKTKVFVSFDYDHDEALKNLFLGQAKHDGTPFEITNVSVQQALLGDWKAKVRLKIKAADQVAVICGEHTHTATGVAAEIKIAQEEGKPYFFLKGYSNKNCYFPTAATASDKMYTWTWENVGLLLKGNR